MPDLGYFGTQGRSASDLRADTLKRLEDIRQQQRETLSSTREQLAFDAQTKRLHQDAVQRVGTHSEQRWKDWAKSVNTTSVGHWSNVLARNPDDPNVFPEATENVIKAYTKTAELHGATPGDQVWLEARDNGRRAALETRLDAIAVNDPAAAQAKAEKFKDILGDHFDNVYNKLRSKADHVNGPIVADEEMGRGPAQGRAQTVMQKFEAAGYTHEQAAAVAGHFYHESGNNPNAVHDGGIGLGIAGWNGDRLDALKKFAADHGKPVNDFNTQVDFAIHELGTTEARAGTALKGANGLADATTAFMHYERPQGYTPGNPQGGDSYGARLSNAAKFAQGNFSALPDKATTFERILDRTQGNPGLQQAALAHANRVYSIYHSDNVQQTANFKANVNDDIAQANRTGAVQTPKTQNDFITALGPEQGPGAYQQYQSELTLGADIASVAGMSPVDVGKLRDTYAPQPGEGYAAQATRLDKLDKAIAAVQKEKQSDPAGFAAERLPVVAQAQGKLIAALGDPKAKPEDRAAAARTYAEITLAEQGRVGVPPQAQRVLPKFYVDNLNGELSSVADNPDPKARGNLVQRIRDEAAIWGEHWPDVMRQLAPASQPIVRAIAAGADPTAMQRLLAAGSEKPGQVIKEQNEVKASEIKTKLNDAMAPFKRSMVGQQKERDYDSYYGLGEKLATLYVRDGDDAATASDKAFKALIGNRYDFRDTYRIPKGAGIPAADDIQAGAQAARGMITSGSTMVSNLSDAKNALNLNPQEEALYNRHFANLTGSGGVNNPDGSRSTLFQAVQEHEGRFYNIPTVWGGRTETEDWTRPADGKRMQVPNKTALANVEKEGWDKFPSYATPEEADARYEKMHSYMEKDTARFLGQRQNAFNIAPARNDMNLDDNREDSLRKFARDGKWVTSYDNSGLNLVYDTVGRGDGLPGTKFIRTADGQPLHLTWAKLAELGGTPQSRKAITDQNALTGLALP